MTTYRLDANPATRREHGYSISYSLRGDRLEGDTATVEVRSAAELIAAKRSHGERVLALNPSLEAVAVSARPTVRHCSGCKNLPYNEIVARVEVPA